MMWDKIVIWTENKGTRKAKDIIDALENGSDGYYIVRDSENRVWGAGDSIRNACINVMNPTCKQNTMDKEMLLALEFFEDDFEVWSLFPAHESLCQSFIKITKVNLRKLQKRTSGCDLDDFLSLLDNHLLCKTMCHEINGIAVLKD